MVTTREKATDERFVSFLTANFINANYDGPREYDALFAPLRLVCESVAKTIGGIRDGDLSDKELGAMAAAAASGIAFLERDIQRHRQLFDECCSDEEDVVD